MTYISSLTTVIDPSYLYLVGKAGEYFSPIQLEASSQMTSFKNIIYL